MILLGKHILDNFPNVFIGYTSREPVAKRRKETAVTLDSPGKLPTKGDG